MPPRARVAFKEPTKLSSISLTSSLIVLVELAAVLVKLVGRLAVLIDADGIDSRDGISASS
jgi:hypothetical protein